MERVDLPGPQSDRVTACRVAGAQRRFRIRLVEILVDEGALDVGVSVVDQGRDDVIGVQLYVFRIVLLSADQVDQMGRVVEALCIEDEADLLGAGGSGVVVELEHRLDKATPRKCRILVEVSAFPKKDMTMLHRPSTTEPSSSCM